MRRLIVLIALLAVALGTSGSAQTTTHLVSITSFQHHPPPRPPDFVDFGWSPWPIDWYGSYSQNGLTLTVDESRSSAYIDGWPAWPYGPQTLARLVAMFPLTPDEYGGLGPIKFDWTVAWVPDTCLRVWRVDYTGDPMGSDFTPYETLVWQSPSPTLYGPRSGRFESQGGAGYYWYIEYAVVPEPSGALVLMGGIALLLRRKLQ